MKKVLIKLISYRIVNSLSFLEDKRSLVREIYDMIFLIEWQQKNNPYTDTCYSYHVNIELLFRVTFNLLGKSIEIDHIVDNENATEIIYVPELGNLFELN